MKYLLREKELQNSASKLSALESYIKFEALAFQKDTDKLETI